jgi:hypothetical protein
MAIIPPSVDIQLGGARQVGPYAYDVRDGDLVSLFVSAEPGDMIWAFAASLDANDEVDYSLVVTLLFDRDAKTGKLSGSFIVPKNLAGRSFQIEAVALSDKGEMSWSTSLIVSVSPSVKAAAENDADPALGK